MPKIIIPNIDLLPLIKEGKMNVGLDQTIIELPDTGPVSDGFHSFDELYTHRCLLYCLMLEVLKDSSLLHLFSPWKSWKHGDGSNFPGWFISGLTLPAGEISYHLPADLWGNCHAEILEYAKKWDGHTSQNVIERISKYLLLSKGDR